MTPTTPNTPPARDEAGSVTTWLVLTVVTFMAIVGLAVDLGGRMHALQRVNDVAAEAARTGGQQLTAADAMRGLTPRLNPSQARAAAVGYVHAAGYAGSARIDGDLLQVTVTGQYTPVFLSVIGAGPITVTGTADARAARALNGAER